MLYSSASQTNRQWGGCASGLGKECAGEFLSGTICIQIAQAIDIFISEAGFPQQAAFSTSGDAGIRQLES
jgi:hypothetical protein